MDNIFVICGKSNSGKDTIMKAIKEMIKHNEINLKVLPVHTTRPKRLYEKDEYIFESKDQFNSDYMDNLICEARTYTPAGVTDGESWCYYTLINDIEPGTNYITINTPEGITSIVNYLNDSNDHKGKFKVHALYIACDDETLLTRAMEREKKQMVPNYKELVRRFMADDNDFSQSELEKLRVKTSLQTFYYNTGKPISFSVMEYIIKTLKNFIMTSSEDELN